MSAEGGAAAAAVGSAGPKFARSLLALAGALLIAALCGERAALAQEAPRPAARTSPTRSAEPPRRATPRAQAKGPTTSDPRARDLVAAFSGSDGCLVQRHRVPERSPSRPTLAPEQVREARLDRAWGIKLARTLGLGAFHAIDTPQTLAWWPEGRDDSRAPMIRIAPADSRDSLSVEIVFERRAAVVRCGARAISFIELAAVIPELFDQVALALPGDTTLEHSRPLRPEANPPDPQHSQVPAYGDYVYVEELPEAITKPPVVYPEAARRAGIEGTVLVQALVGRDGHVLDVRVQKSIPELDSAAVANVQRWVFKPALTKGQPVAVWVAIPVRFTLH